MCKTVGGGGIFGEKLFISGYLAARLLKFLLVVVLEFYTSVLYILMAYV